jgi:hypothetical protein
MFAVDLAHGTRAMCTVCPTLCRELRAWLTATLTAPADGRDGSGCQHVCFVCREPTLREKLTLVTGVDRYW